MDYFNGLDEHVFDPSRAAHPIERRLSDERCILCGAPASHVIFEQVKSPRIAPVGMLCCNHFTWIFGDCVKLEYTLPEQRC
jgi:hypothetical protein